MRKCPNCTEIIPKQMTKCPFCQYSIPAQPKRLNKIALLSVILVALLVVGVGSYFLVNSSNSIVKQKTDTVDYTEMTQSFIKKEGLNMNDVLVYNSEDRHSIYYVKDASFKQYDMTDDVIVTLDSFHCTNGMDIEFTYGLECIFDGQRIAILGDYDGLGEFAGAYVISYDVASDTFEYVGFGRYVERIGNIIKITTKQLIKDNGHHLSNDYNYVNNYYDASGKLITPNLYSGTVGPYPIIMELIDIKDGGRVVGSYYYRKQGPENRMYLKGGLDGRSLILYGYANQSADAQLIETLTGFNTGDQIEGTWRSNLDNRELPLLLTKENVN